MSAENGGSSDERGKKPGFLRRMFGGGSAPAPLTPEQAPERAPDDARHAPRTIDAVEVLTPESEVLLRTSVADFTDAVPVPLDAIELDPFSREMLHETLPSGLPPSPPDNDLQPGNGEPQREGVGWWSRLRKGLARSSSSLGQGLTGLFVKRKLDLSTIEDLEDLLIRADLGVSTALRIVDKVREGRFEKGIGADDVQGIIANEVERALEPVARPLTIPRSDHPFVILVIGVNGSGKTTTIGKLAAKFKAEGKSVMLAAGDTFRAAAVEQLRIWGSRIDVPVIARDTGADAAGLAFDAIKAARETRIDVLLIDTAGRLQNRAELMDELAKVLRVIKKLDADAPHAVLLVLDATVGQNAMSQVDIFGRVAGVTGLVMTKLDGTARGGILVAIAETYKLPIHFIGVGEGVDDLEPFAARDFARAIAGLDR